MDMSPHIHRCAVRRSDSSAQYCLSRMGSLCVGGVWYKTTIEWAGQCEAQWIRMQVEVMADIAVGVLRFKTVEWYE